MTQVLIKVDNVSKKFAKDFKKSLWYGVKDVFSKVHRTQKNNDLRSSEFWAVKQVNFEVKKGECLGLIGHNGAGKSTLLKMLNGLIAPDEGRITMHGKVAALIELGAGFNPILTGRENIYNNAAVMGFTRQQVDEKYESIVAFSEIGEFINTPVQNYSSGMKVRLGFAIAAQMEPDVLLIDEVLAVGDLGFRIKCMNRIQELLRNCAVIFVSHAMTQVTAICTNVLLMDHGEIEFQGSDVGLGVQKYFVKFSGIDAKKITADEEISLNNVTLTSPKGTQENNVLVVDHGADLSFEFEVAVNESIENINVRLGFFNMEQRLIAEVDSRHGKHKLTTTNGTFKIKTTIKNVLFKYGKYSIHVHVLTGDKHVKQLLRESDVAEFIVRETITTGADIILDADWSCN